jgi:uncharacterized membrane protein YeiB
MSSAIAMGIRSSLRWIYLTRKPKEKSMSKTAVILFVFIASIIPSAAVQQMPSSSAQAANSQANIADNAERAQLKQMSSADAQAMQDDIKKMRSLVEQMETNLVSVDTSQSPLKHQFQLDIDMWKTLLNQMERKAQANSR